MLALASSALFSCAIVLRSPSRPDATLIATGRVNEPRGEGEMPPVSFDLSKLPLMTPALMTLVITNFRVPL